MFPFPCPAVLNVSSFTDDAVRAAYQKAHVPNGLSFSMLENVDHFGVFFNTNFSIQIFLSLNVPSSIWSSLRLSGRSCLHFVKSGIACTKARQGTCQSCSQTCCTACAIDPHAIRAGHWVLF